MYELACMRTRILNNFNYLIELYNRYFIIFFLSIVSTFDYRLLSFSILRLIFAPTMCLNLSSFVRLCSRVCVRSYGLPSSHVLLLIIDEKKKKKSRSQNFNASSSTLSAHLYRTINPKTPSSNCIHRLTRCCLTA